MENKESDTQKERIESRYKYLERREKSRYEYQRRYYEEEKKYFRDEILTDREKKRLKLQEEYLEKAEKLDTFVSEYNDTKEKLLYKVPDTATNLQSGIVDTRIREEQFNRTHKDIYGNEKTNTQNLLEQEKLLASGINIKKASIKSKTIREDDKTILPILENIKESQVELNLLKSILSGNDIESSIKEEEEIEEYNEKKRIEIYKNKRQILQENRKNMPVYNYKDKIIDTINNNQVVIIVGETGSGKTTQILQYLYEYGYGKDDNKILACTQPRRVAAISVATRVAEEMNCIIGQLVGYTIRFDDNTSEFTRIKYMTDGIFLREFLQSPELEKYSVIMIDEAHERTISTDVLLGLIKEICKLRKDIKILISSATLDSKKFSNYFNNAPIIQIPGRRYPVDIYYTNSPEGDYADAVIATILQIHVTQELPGDILAFLPGQDDIEYIMEILNERINGLGDIIGTKVPFLTILPIYSNLPNEQQKKIFYPPPLNTRKVVLATNIAETSITIDGIIYVIDTGMCKINTYEPKIGMESLIITSISRASADQRAGRAGRTGPGKCFRLYTKSYYEYDMENTTIPEIQRSNLSSIILLLKSIGINDLLHFDFLDPPPVQTLSQALELLYALGALNTQGNLTKLGRKIVDLPINPMLAKFLLKSQEYYCVQPSLTICAMLSIDGTLFYRPRAASGKADIAHSQFYNPLGDHLTLLRVYEEWEDTDYDSQWCFENFLQYKSLIRAKDIRQQLLHMCTRVDINEDVDITYKEDIPIDIRYRKAITSGFFYHTSKYIGDTMYRTLKGKNDVLLHPSSSLSKRVYKDLRKVQKKYKIIGEGAFTEDEVHTKPPIWVIYHEIVHTSKNYMRCCLEIDIEWLYTIAPHYYSRTKRSSTV